MLTESGQQAMNQYSLETIYRRSKVRLQKNSEQSKWTMQTSAFSWIAGDAVAVDGPLDDPSAACDYDTDALLQGAYSTWLAQFTTDNPGCGTGGGQAAFH